MTHPRRPIGTPYSSMPASPRGLPAKGKGGEAQLLDLRLPAVVGQAPGAERGARRAPGGHRHRRRARVPAATRGWGRSPPLDRLSEIMLARGPHRPADGLTVTMVAFDLLAVTGTDLPALPWQPGATGPCPRLSTSR